MFLFREMTYKLTSFFNIRQVFKRTKPTRLSFWVLRLFREKTTLSRSRFKVSGNLDHRSGGGRKDKNRDRWDKT